MLGWRFRRTKRHTEQRMLISKLNIKYNDHSSDDYDNCDDCDIDISKHNIHDNSSYVCDWQLRIRSVPRC